MGRTSRVQRCILWLWGDACETCTWRQVGSLNSVVLSSMEIQVYDISTFRWYLKYGKKKMLQEIKYQQQKYTPGNEPGGTLSREAQKKRWGGIWVKHLCMKHRNRKQEICGYSRHRNVENDRGKNREVSKNKIYLRDYGWIIV